MCVPLPPFDAIADWFGLSQCNICVKGKQQLSKSAWFDLKAMLCIRALKGYGFTTYNYLRLKLKTEQCTLRCIFFKV